MSIADLKEEIRRRERKLKTLHRRREKILSQLSEVDAEIIANGGTVGHGNGVVRKRPKNSANLADTLAKTLKGKTMSVTEVAEAVQKHGYRTTSPNFRTIVNQTLIKDKRIKRVGHGKYTAR